MTNITCPECEMDQDITITEDTYTVICEHCGSRFDIPRKFRVNKREVKEYTSHVNIRIGLDIRDEKLVVGWTVQSANKQNQYMEKNSAIVDIANHPQKTYWYVAVFKALQHIDEYKEARIWVKHQQILDHLVGDLNVSGDDLRSHLTKKIVKMCDEKFYGYEFAENDHSGHDIAGMIAATLPQEN